MELILDMPMLANHRNEVGSRPYQASKVDMVVTRHRGLLVGHPNRFDDHHGFEVRPFGEHRECFKVCYDPDSAAYTPSVGVVKGIKEIVRIAPGQIVLDSLSRSSREDASSV